MIKTIILAECTYALYPILTIVGYPLLIVFSVIRGIYKCLSSWRPEKSIVGEVALITGSGRGLGRLIAIELAKRGCHIAIVDIQSELAEETAKFIAGLCKVKTKAYKIDVTNYEQLEDLKTQITNDLGDVTILINNAGILTLSSIDNPPVQEVQRMINVNFNSVVYTTQIFLPKMKELNRGHIVNISSMASLMPLQLCAIYGATKSAVRHMTASLRIGLMQQKCNITATTMMPTFLNTNHNVVHILNQIDGHTFGPQLDGDLVVQYLVRAMLNGDDEVTVPRVFFYLYKLTELLPTYVREKLSALWTQHNMDKAYSDRVSSILKQSELYIGPKFQK